MFHLMNVASIRLTIQLWPFFETWCLEILTVNLHDAHVENVPKSFQTPTSSCQHINVNRFLYTTITTVQPPTAAVERPGSLSTSTIPCTTPPPPLCSSTYVACPRNHIEDNDNNLRGLMDWGESVDRESGKMTIMQYATHMLYCLHFYFQFFYVIWWHGMQPTCRIIYSFIFF